MIDIKNFVWFFFAFVAIVVVLLVRTMWRRLAQSKFFNYHDSLSPFEFQSLSTVSRKSLLVAHRNVRSLARKSDDICDVVLSSNIDIVDVCLKHGLMTLFHLCTTAWLNYI